MGRFIPLLLFALGLAIGILVTVGIFGFRSYGKKWSEQHPMVVMQTDENVRVKIKAADVPLPDSAHHLFYFFDHGIDYDELVAFSASAQDCRRAVNAYLKFKGKDPAKLVPGTGPDPWRDVFTTLPQDWNPKWKTPLWDFSTVKHGLKYEEGYLFVLFDTDHNRVYIVTWSS